MSATSTRQGVAPLKVYRFALYGGAAAGKTCILAALAMPRLVHPRGYTCVWMPQLVGLPRPPGEPATWNHQDTAAAFHLGSDWLQQAKEALSRREPPKGNRNREPLRFLYDFTTPDHRTLRIELSDYSGELLDPRLTNDALATRLRHHMQDMDAILVLAEAPHQGEEHQQLAEEFHRLQQAFATLRGQMQDGSALNIPIALLINKWDRRNSSAEQNNTCDLELFLNADPQPPQRTLVENLRGSVTAGNFEDLPCQRIRGA